MDYLIGLFSKIFCRKIIIIFIYLLRVSRYITPIIYDHFKKKSLRWMIKSFTMKKISQHEKHTFENPD